MLTYSDWKKYKFKHRYNTTRYQITKLHHFPFISVCSFSLSLSLISQWILRTWTFISSHVVLVVVLGAPSGKCGDGGWDYIVFSFFANNSYKMLHFESFVFTCVKYNYVQHFRNGLIHKFYGLKASQMSKVHASSHKYLHVEKNQESSWTEFQEWSNNKQ